MSLYNVNPYGYEITDEVLKHLRGEAIRAKFHADACQDAYESALERSFQDMLTEKIGHARGEEVKCVLDFKDGPEEVLVIGIRISYFSITPELVVKQKLKSGRWGKSECYYDATWAINALRKSKSS